MKIKDLLAILKLELGIPIFLISFYIYYPLAFLQILWLALCSLLSGSGLLVIFTLIKASVEDVKEQKRMIKDKKVEKKYKSRKRKEGK